MAYPENNTSPWISFDLDNWSGLLLGRTPKRFAKKSVIYQQEQDASHIYLLKSGRVRITSYQLNGAEKQFCIAEKGCIFGENACLMGTTHTNSAVSIVDSEVYCVPTAEFESAMHADWKLARFVMYAICHKNNILQQQILDLSFAQALQRVTRVLVNLEQEYGVATPDGVKISIHFTHQDVANITNTSRVTVSNIFNRLADTGAIKKEQGYFILTDLTVLSNYADGALDVE